jgi:glucan phosphoethanolaminetransferase (alkaline phosphatase superfamily)
MKKRTKRILISALLATLLEAILVGLATVAQRTSNGQDIFTFCLMPFYMIAAVLTHNAEDTSGVLIYSLMFLFFLGITYLAQVMWARIRKP